MVKVIILPPNNVTDKWPYHNKHGQYLNKLGMVAQLQTKMLG